MGGAKFDIEKFTCDNDFGLWRIKMKALMVYQVLQDALFGISKMPATLSKKEKKDTEIKAHNIVILSRGDDAIREVAAQDTTASVWLKLESLYMTKSLTNKLYLKKSLHQMKMEEGEYINSMPKLAVPADGGHHDPMMKTIVISLVSFPTQKEKTIELVECILASESEKYVDPSLRHFFMMNSWRYLEQANKIRDLYDIFGNVCFQKIKSKVQQNLELYQRSSWDKVLEFLKLDINDSVETNIAVDSMKTKLSMFNMHFKEICRVQCIWSVHDMNLREEIIASLKNILLPAYGIFIGRFQDFLKNKAYDYIEYGMFDIQDILDNMFLGNKKNN